MEVVLSSSFFLSHTSFQSHICLKFSNTKPQKFTGLKARIPFMMETQMHNAWPTCVSCFNHMRCDM